ncbi:MAG: aromatic ring-hydroxylating dioxygenase subunit alpha [Betaproteobacteria bacterium]|nr:aromatic ring-hydroxylating dioxygenase subunit alpha [Betaproteobacteria bacterium]
MGELFRRYWLPALLAREVMQADGEPVRVQLLSERLLAFRDSAGRLGLIGEACAHRGASLWFGRNEEGGIRCPFHGWKYDVSGQCLEIPSEPPERGIHAKIKLASYPLVERGGVLWTYMGSPALRPPLPEFEFALVAPTQRYLSKRIQECNYLQAMEGGIDSSHVGFLHRGSVETDPLSKNALEGNRYTLTDHRVHFEVAESPGGLYIAARRKADNGNFYWRVTQWVMPCFTNIPPRGQNPTRGHFWVPIDDHNCWAWNYDYHPLRDLTEAELRAMEDGSGVHTELIPGSYVPVRNKRNNYMMDRKAQIAGISFSGIEGVANQDCAMQESIGLIADHTREHLVGTDRGVIMARQRLVSAAHAVKEGRQPPGIDPASHRVRSVAIVLPPDVSFQDAVREGMLAREGAPLVTV